MNTSVTISRNLLVLNLILILVLTNERLGFAGSILVFCLLLQCAKNRFVLLRVILWIALDGTIQKRSTNYTKFHEQVLQSVLYVS